MSNNWTGTGIWSGWRMDGERLIAPSGRAYRPDDIELTEYNQSDLARALGVTRAAISDRMRRGTVPPFDNPDKKTWYTSTISHLFK